MIPRDTIKKAGTTFTQLALSMTALSGGANSYYRTQQGFYSPGKEMVAQLNAKPLSATAIQNSDWQKSLEPVVNENKNELELKKTRQARELIIVDSAVEDKHIIFKQAQPGVDIVELESGKDGMVELINILSNYSNLDGVHIVSHAKSGAIQLGGQTIDQKELEEDLVGFAAINSAIREGGDLMLYGCDLAKGDEGDEFLEIIKNNTHVDVAASEDPTGNEAYGGNWNLEIQKGDIEAKPLAQSIAMKDFTGILQFTTPINLTNFNGGNSGYFAASTINNVNGSSYNLSISSDSNTGFEFYGVNFGRVYVNVSYSNTMSKVYLEFSNNETFDVEYIHVENSYVDYSRDLLFSSDLGDNHAQLISESVDQKVTLSGFTGISRLTIEKNGGGSLDWFNIDRLKVSNVSNAVSIPTVTTTVESGVGSTSATLGGNVTGDGGATVIGRGIVWDTATSPDVNNDNVVSMSSGTGSFNQSVGLLPFGTTIYYRAYATNTEGTAYGGEESFTTSNTVTVDLTGAEGWRLLSAPASVSLATFLGPIWTQGVTTGEDTDFGTPNVYTWSTSVDGNNQGDWQAVTDLTGTTLAGGHGFMVHVYADPDYDGSTSPGFPQTLSVTGSEFVSGTSPTMNSNVTGWTLLGNPFASAIDYEVLTKSNLASPIYVWNPNDNNGDANGNTEPDQSTGSWNTWNGSVGDVAGGRIAPFQGFLVQNNGSVGSVTFTQTSKTSTASTFLGKEKEIPFVRLELQGQGMRNSAWLEFSSDGSTEKIDADAWELTPLSSNYAMLATRKADGSLMDIGRYPQSSELEIPLITEATQSGRYVLNVTDYEAPGQTLYLNDLHNNESIRLEKNTRYEFTIHQTAKAPANPFAILQDGLKKQADSSHRFVISSSALENPGLETPQQFTLNQNYPNPFNPTTVISYELPQSAQVRLEVYDMAGRQVATLVIGQVAAGRHTINFDAGNLSSGVYMYSLQTKSGIITKKLTLIK